jgi:hypothetical protein
MVTSNKKQYAGLISCQEGKVIDPPKLDVKGMSIKKTTTSKEVRDYFVDLLRKDILGSEGSPNVGAILRKFHDFEQRVKDSISSGETTFAVPMKYNDPGSYVDPFSLPVVRGVMVWNELFPDNLIMPASKCILLKMKCKKLEDLAPMHADYPEEYAVIKAAVWDQSYVKKGRGGKGDEEFNFMAKHGFSIIAMPKGWPEIPEFLRPYVNVEQIANDNVRNALVLLESLGLKNLVVLSENYYSNIIRL